MQWRPPFIAIFLSRPAHSSNHTHTHTRTRGLEMSCTRLHPLQPLCRSPPSHPPTILTHIHTRRYTHTHTHAHTLRVERQLASCPNMKKCIYDEEWWKGSVLPRALLAAACCCVHLATVPVGSTRWLITAGTYWQPRSGLSHTHAHTCLEYCTVRTSRYTLAHLGGWGPALAHDAALGTRRNAFAVSAFFSRIAWNVALLGEICLRGESRGATCPRT